MLERFPSISGDQVTAAANACMSNYSAVNADVLQYCRPSSSDFFVTLGLLPGFLVDRGKNEGLKICIV